MINRPSATRSLRVALHLSIWLQTCGGITSAKELAEYVNTLQGTNSRFEFSNGNTYPTVALPFGMHTWTPQTGTNGDGWKYQYHMETIRGFQQAHQCSSWSNDYNVFSFMPVVGDLVVDEHQRASKFRHSDETARPYDYRVKLASGVQVELAPTEHGAWLRLTFPEQGAAYLVLDGYTGFASMNIDADRQNVAGTVRNGRNLPEGFLNHFVAQFDQPFVSHGTWRTRRRNRVAIEPGSDSIRGRRLGTYYEFAPGSTVDVRVASSYIDADQAERNLERQLGGMQDIAAVRAAAKEAWNRTLGKVTVEGGTEEEQSTFYSCLFRASLFPRKFYELDQHGEPYYRSPYDGQVHRGYMYTDTGLWDTFRAQMPLNALLHPQMHGRYVQAMLAAQEQCGWLPSWSFPGEAGSMIGNHAVTVLADAWAKGIRTFDPALALEAYEHEASHKGPWGPANGRGGADDLARLGYLPYPEYREATSKTLEYAYDDFCGYLLAEEVGHDRLREQFADSMNNYRNVYDAETGFMRGRDADGNWTEPFDPIEWGGPYTEGCAWHWQWSVFHDVAGLIELMGGEQAFVDKLDAVFAATNEYKVGTYGAPIHEMREMSAADLGQYAHGNQPIQHMPYLYNYAAAPWKAQYRVRQIMQRLYDSSENGYPGDEDQGQTSSWYVLSALGFYSVCPGTDQYVLGSPVFNMATLHLENGNRFVIEANGNSPESVYIDAARLNDAVWNHNYVRHQDVTSGGRLRLEMSTSPNRTRGTSDSAKPFSVSTQLESAAR